MKAKWTFTIGRVSGQLDLHLLESVLKNLLYNASRYAKREIRVSFSARDGVNELLVDDDGPGIPEPDRKRAFDSFVQLDQSWSQEERIRDGLAIVKRAIEWHSGQIVITQAVVAPPAERQPPDAPKASPVSRACLC